VEGYAQMYIHMTAQHTRGETICMVHVYSSKEYSYRRVAKLFVRLVKDLI